MYLVYTRRNVQFEVVDPAIMIGIYARKEGAIARAKMMSNEYPGLTYVVGLLPEGSKPDADACTEVEYLAMVSMPHRVDPADRPMYKLSEAPDADGLPF